MIQLTMHDYGRRLRVEYTRNIKKWGGKLAVPELREWAILLPTMSNEELDAKISEANSVMNSFQKEFHGIREFYDYHLKEVKELLEILEQLRYHRIIANGGYVACFEPDKLFRLLGDDE